jgi:putative FmdB family regulatory protein
MPSYDYQCLKCGNIQEELHPMAGPSEKIKCNKCRSTKVKRIISAPYVKFNGPGWQTNDVRGIAKPSGAPDIDSSSF